MDKTRPKQHTYIIDDPNEPGALLCMIQRILLEKLIALPPEEPDQGHCQGKEQPPNEDRSLLPCFHGQG